METKTIQTDLEQIINESFDRIFEEIDEFEKDLVFYKMNKVSNNKFGGVRGDI